MNALYQRLKELDPRIFEDLCFQLIASRHPNANILKVNGAGGDRGIDIFQGELGGEPTIWQCKCFANGIRSAQKNQIKKSLRNALQNFRPKRWILCIPVDLDVNAHAWLQQLKREHAARVEIGIFQASHIVRELIQQRPIRNTFFPNAILDALELRSLLAKTGEYSNRELEKLTLENIQQYVQRLRDRDARFDYQVTFFPPNSSRTNYPPGVVASITDQDKRIDIFPRDVEALQLDPPIVQFGVAGDDARMLQHAIETGNEVEVQVSKFRSSFDFLAPAVADSQQLIIKPSAHHQPPIYLTVMFGTGKSAVQYESLEFRRPRVGTKEVELVSANTGLPFVFSIVIRLGSSASAGGTFHFEQRFEGRDIRPVHKAAAALYALKQTGFIEVRDARRDAVIFTATTDTAALTGLNERFKCLLDDVYEIATRFRAQLHVPDVVDNETIESVPFFLELIRNGQVEIELSNISATVTKSTQHRDMFMAALKSEKSFKFDLVGFVPPGRIFGTAIQLGPCSIFADRALIKEPDDVLRKYLSAEEGEGVVMEFTTLSPARIVLGTAQFTNTDTASEVVTETVAHPPFD